MRKVAEEILAAFSQDEEAGRTQQSTVEERERVWVAGHHDPLKAGRVHDEDTQTNGDQHSNICLRVGEEAVLEEGDLGGAAGPNMDSLPDHNHEVPRALADGQDVLLVSGRIDMSRVRSEWALGRRCEVIIFGTREVSEGDAVGSKDLQPREERESQQRREREWRHGPDRRRNSKCLFR